MTIIITLMILLAGIGIGTVVLEGSKRAVATDQSVLAYYMSDSGIERQLYEVRKNNATLSQISSLAATYPGGGAWTYFGGFASTTQKTFASMATNTFQVVDLFNPDNVSAAGVAQMTVSWSNGANCQVGQYAGFETGYAEWDLSTNIIPSNFTLQRQACPGACTQSQTILLDPAKAYRVRMRSLNCAAANVTASVFNSGGSPQTFPGDITLAAEGTWGNATQKIAVTMPKLDILSGIFSYVIFSECTLIKGTATEVCPP